MGIEYQSNLLPTIPGSFSVTYVVEPGHLVGLRIRVDVALEVDIVALLDVVRVQGGAQFQSHRGNICKEKKKKGR